LDQKKRQVDFLIVGQGIAGTLLTHFLLEDGHSVHVIDPAHEYSASRVAAGLINPITGRHFVKSWRIEELIPSAEKTYRDLEAKLGIEIFHPRGLIRSMFSVRQENDWLSRTGDPSYAPYMKEEADLGDYREAVHPAHSYGEVRHAAQVNIEEVVTAYRRYLLERDLLIPSSFDYPSLSLSPEVIPEGQSRNTAGGQEEEWVSYQGLLAKQVIFAEGYWAQFNPFFSYLPFKGDKGDVLIIRIPGAHFERILKHRVFLVPLKDDQYWVGATYVKEFETAKPVATGKTEMLRRLRETLRIPFEIVEHRAAVRPTVKDRRPFLGRHPDFPQLAIFNGLGTKGTSLGPFFARQLINHLTKNDTLDEAVNIARYEKEKT